MELFDSHAHYNDEKFNEDRNELIPELYKKGITKIIVAGYNVTSSKKAIQIANEYEYIYTTCGISPNDIPQNDEQLQKELKPIEEMAQNKKVKAIGEIGLDYYWNKENKEFQKKVFKEQIHIANQLKLPIVIHSRDAVMDTLNILKEFPVIKTGVFHCCQLNKELIKEALKLGYYISFAGPVTFKNSKNASEVITQVPIDKILIETDSPYLSPEPNRGKRNDSSNVIYIAEKIAQIKGISVGEVAKTTYGNTCKIFEIAK